MLNLIPALGLIGVLLGLPLPVATQIAEQAPLSAAQVRDPDWRMRVTLYHQGGGGAGPRDSLGCVPVAMRTAAADRAVAPRRSILFIPETVGLEMPNGERHDGLWYVSDTGPAIRGQRIDLFTGMGRRSMDPIMHLNVQHVDVVRMGTFQGCPAQD
ncbi:MAG TPA: 3D domain-containing protein [Brevundimonas sp.]|jgi:3D (Asp-Asp-Asp) domain-containing protein|uniref:3D domain-containing protein n=1 Tax=Brevundimonas sp. TaxID=1871086 RepID=UPI002BD94166|nr:3D domain-containing protein [Brevundimonas sp.]HRH20880.1 3D domain-containing protein [Brevundimonas sp.]